MKQAAQLALMVQLPDDETFDSYLSESNHLVISQLTLFLERIERGQLNQPRSFYLFGLTIMSCQNRHLIVFL